MAEFDGSQQYNDVKSAVVHNIYEQVLAPIQRTTMRPAHRHAVESPVPTIIPGALRIGGPSAGTHAAADWSPIARRATSTTGVRER